MDLLSLGSGYTGDTSSKQTMLKVVSKYMTSEDQRLIQDKLSSSSEACSEGSRQRFSCSKLRQGLGVCILSTPGVPDENGPGILL